MAPALRARGAAWETGHPYGVLSQLLGSPVDAADPVAAGSVLVEALAGDETTLVVVDDATWSDAESLQALSSAVHHHRDAALLVLLVSRTGDPTVPAATLRLLSGHERLVVPPLDARGVRRLAAARGTHLHPSLADRLCRHTGGRPAHVLALLEELPPATWNEFDPQLPAPSAVAAEVAERLPTLSAAARSLVEAVAVLGTATTLAEATAVAGLDEPLPALDDAVRAGLLHTVEGRGVTLVEPADPMLAAAVLDTLGGARRAAVHTRAAEVVPEPARRLGHRVAASPLPDPLLADELEDLAGERAASGAWGEVAELLAQASRLTDDRRRREDLLARAADALVGAGDALGAAALVPELESLRETPLRNAVLGYLAVVRGRPSEAEARLRRAWDLVNVERDPDVAATVCQRWVLHGLGRCRGDDVVEWADRAISLAPAESPAAVEAAAIRGLGVAASGRPREALEAYARLAEQVGHGAQAQRISMGWGWLLLAEDDLDAATAAWSRRSRRTTWEARPGSRCGPGPGWPVRSSRRAAGTTPSGRRRKASTSSNGRACGWSGRCSGGPRPRSWSCAARTTPPGRCCAPPPRRDRATTRSCVFPPASRERRTPRPTPTTPVWCAPSRRCASPGRRGRSTSPAPGPGLTYSPTPSSSRAGWTRPTGCSHPHEKLARERGHRSARARLGYARGRLQGAQGDIDAATATFDESLRLLEDLPLRYDRARVNFAYGQTLRRAGRRREADARPLRGARPLRVDGGDDVRRSGASAS